MVIKDQETGRLDVTALVIPVLVDNHRFELRDHFDALIKQKMCKVVVDIRNVRPMSTDVPGAIIHGTESFRKAGGVVHLVVDAHQMEALKQMHLDRVQDLWNLFLDDFQGAVDAFSPPPELANAS